MRQKCQRMDCSRQEEHHLPAGFPVFLPPSFAGVDAVEPRVFRLPLASSLSQLGVVAGESNCARTAAGSGGMKMLDSPAWQPLAPVLSQIVFLLGHLDPRGRPVLTPDSRVQQHVARGSRVDKARANDVGGFGWTALSLCADFTDVGGLVDNEHLSIHWPLRVSCSGFRWSQNVTAATVSEEVSALTWVRGNIESHSKVLWACCLQITLTTHM
jgi:hypothetical protein